MPAAPARRQPDSAPRTWFESPDAIRLVQEVQRHVVPELTRVFGQVGLFLRPSPAIAPVLSGNMVGEVVSLHRDRDGFAGALRCDDAALPLVAGSVSVACALFVCETSPDPAALIDGLARVLKPEGRAIIVGLNPFAPMRLRWAMRGPAPVGRGRMAAMLGAAGLEVERRRFIGPHWSPPARYDPAPAAGDGALAPLRMAWLLVARRREPGTTPLLVDAPVVGLRPGISPG